MDVLDASGDSDVCNFAGAPTEIGGNYHTYISFQADLESCQKALEKQDIAHLVHGRLAGNANLYGKGHPEGMPLWDGTDGDSVSSYLVTNQLQLLDNIKDDDRKSRDITLLPIMPQFRTTRHLVGNYVLQPEDTYRHFEDSVCALCDFERRDYLYEVPYRSLVLDGFDNLIAAGRCVSAERYAWDVVRVIPPAILTGQAAGAAVSQALDDGKPITGIDVSVLQARLAKENVIIHFDDALVPADTNKVETADIGHI